MGKAIYRGVRNRTYNRVKGQTTILRHCQTPQEHARNNASGPAKGFLSA